MKIEDKIQIFKNQLDKYFEVDKYNYPENDIYDYFFLSYTKNDVEYNNIQFSFLNSLKSENEIIKVIDAIISRCREHRDDYNLENTIESYIACDFLFLEKKNYSSKEFFKALDSNKNILYLE